MPMRLLVKFRPWRSWALRHALEYVAPPSNTILNLCFLEWYTPWCGIYKTLLIWVALAFSLGDTQQQSLSQKCWPWTSCIPDGSCFFKMLFVQQYDYGWRAQCLHFWMAILSTNLTDLETLSINMWSSCDIPRRSSCRRSGNSYLICCCINSPILTNRNPMGHHNGVSKFWDTGLPKIYS